MQVPHVPAGREAPEHLPTVRVHQSTGVIEFPDADPSLHLSESEEPIPIPVKEADSVTYEHVGHQWVLDGKTMQKRQGAADGYGSGTLSLFKDVFSHSYKENIATQHSMCLYVERYVNVTGVAANMILIHRLSESR